MSKMTEWLEGMTLADADIKREIMLFPFGEFDHPSYGKLKFDKKFFNEVIENYQSNVLGVKPFIDQQHDEDKSLAWLNTPPFIRPGLGLFVKPDWTNLGKKLLQEKIYKYFSPSWGPYKNPETGKKFDNVLMGGAATNIPFLKTMPSMIDEKKAASEQTVKLMLSDLVISDSLAVKAKADDADKQTLDELNKNKGDKIMKDKLIETLKLSADATDESILEKIASMFAENETIKSELSEIKAKLDDNSDKVLTDELSETKKQLSDIKIKLVQKDCDTAIKCAISEGRIKPADKEYWEKRFLSDPTNVTEDLKKMAVAVDLNEVGSAGAGEKKLSDDPGKQYVDECQKLIAAGTAKNFTDAATIVSSENPKLAEAYLAKYQA
jgi:hypothetical protein